MTAASDDRRRLFSAAISFLGNRDVMLNYIKRKLAVFSQQLITMDLLDFNHYIFQRLILKLFKTEHVLPFIAALCVVVFSLVTQESRFIFFPQTSLGAFASFTIFTLVVSLLTIVIYPLVLIFCINFLFGQLKHNAKRKYWLKFICLVAGFIAGAFF